MEGSRVSQGALAKVDRQMKERVPVFGGTFHGLLRGMIDGVSTRGASVNGAAQTLVSVRLEVIGSERLRPGGFGGPALARVPITSPKIGWRDGERWTPQVGDLVLVGFVQGNLRDPVVLGALPPPGSELEPAAEDEAGYLRQCHGTLERIRTDGRREVFVAADDFLEVVGDGAVTIGGNVTVTVQGNATIQVIGSTDLTSPTVTITAATKVTLDTPLVEVTGEIQATGNVSSGANVSDVTGTMGAMRGTYNPHNHAESGGGTTGAPNQAM